MQHKIPSVANQSSRATPRPKSQGPRLSEKPNEFLSLSRVGNPLLSGHLCASCANGIAVSGTLSVFQTQLPPSGLNPHDSPSAVHSFIRLGETQMKRRDFLKSSAAVAGATMASRLGLGQSTVEPSARPTLSSSSSTSSVGPPSFPSESITPNSISSALCLTSSSMSGRAA
jgi:hypothetical protein